MPRPDWDSVWMQVADSIGPRSRCSRRGIGAVIVDGTNRPVSTGYNSPPAGMELPSDECKDWCPRAMTTDEFASIAYVNCYSVHSEINALMFADRRDYVGGTLYVTSSICWDCARAVANSGIKRVVVKIDYLRDAHREPERVLEFLDNCGLEYTVWQD